MGKVDFGVFSIDYMWRPLANISYCGLGVSVRREKWRWNGVDIYFRSGDIGGTPKSKNFKTRK